MAMILCKGCRKSYSQLATACPECGAPNHYLKSKSTPKGSELMGWKKWAVIFIFAIYALILLAPSENAPNVAVTNSQQHASNMAGGNGAPLSVASDPKAKYSILNIESDGALRIITTRRIGSSGESISVRIYDCQNGLVKYADDHGPLSPVVPGTIAHEVGVAACIL